MNVALFGATGMVGQGVLGECLGDPQVESVLVVGRSATGRQDPKLREHVVSDVTALSSVAPEIARIDATFFCVGVSSLGKNEADYTRLTFELTLSVARALAAIRPAMTFVYVSGMGTDSSERGRTMWARVKGRTENALLALPFKAAYMFRPGMIVPGPGIQSRTTWYRLLYAITRPLGPVVQRFFPNAVTTSEQLGRAMLAVARGGYPARVLETRDINSL